ncbi:hypothetical protein ACSS6W_004662 [Trichoderma asperelloides]
MVLSVFPNKYALIGIKRAVPICRLSSHRYCWLSTLAEKQRKTTMNLPGVTPELPHVRVGVSAVIRDKDGKFLVGKRKGSHGAARNAEFRLETGELSQKNNNRVSLTGYGTNDTGTLQTPGGHLEHGEDLGACAVRETEEETGLVVTAGNVITITNDVFNGEGKHYITIFVDCAMTDPNATPETKEPLKCEGWEWKSWDELKRINEAAASDPSGDKLFLPLVNLVKQTADLNALIASKSQ